MYEYREHWSRDWKPVEGADKITFEPGHVVFWESRFHKLERDLLILAVENRRVADVREVPDAEAD